MAKSLSPTQVQFIHNSHGHLKSILEEVYKGSVENYAVVAFIGKGADSFLRSAKGIKVVCNAESVGTNPDGLKSLMEVFVDLRSDSKLHSKIYLSEHGALVGSANLSENALEMVEGIVKSKEALVWIPRVYKKQYNDIKDYCGDLWKSSTPVNESMIKRLEKKRNNVNSTKKVTSLELLLSRQNLVFGFMFGNPELAEGIKTPLGHELENWFEEPFIEPHQLTFLSNKNIYHKAERDTDYSFLRSTKGERMTGPRDDRKGSASTVAFPLVVQIDPYPEIEKFKSKLEKIFKYIRRKKKKFDELEAEFGQIAEITYFVDNEEKRLSGFYFTPANLDKILRVVSKG